MAKILLYWGWQLSYDGVGWAHERDWRVGRSGHTSNGCHPWRIFTLLSFELFASTCWVRLHNMLSMVAHHVDKRCSTWRDDDVIYYWLQLSIMRFCWKDAFLIVYIYHENSRVLLNLLISLESIQKPSSHRNMTIVNLSTKVFEPKTERSLLQLCWGEGHLKGT